MSKIDEANAAFKETFDVAMSMSGGDYSYSASQAADAFALVAGETAVAPSVVAS